MSSSLDASTWSVLQRRVRGMDAEVATLRKARDEALQKANKNDAALTSALSELAQRMETLAAGLNGRPQPPQA